MASRDPAPSRFCFTLVILKNIVKIREFPSMPVPRAQLSFATSFAFHRAPLYLCRRKADAVFLYRFEVALQQASAASRREITDPVMSRAYRLHPALRGTCLVLYGCLAPKRRAAPTACPAPIRHAPRLYGMPRAYTACLAPIRRASRLRGVPRAYTACLAPIRRASRLHGVPSAYTA